MAQHPAHVAGPRARGGRRGRVRQGALVAVAALPQLGTGARCGARAGGQGAVGAAGARAKVAAGARPRTRLGAAAARLADGLVVPVVAAVQLRGLLLVLLDARDVVDDVQGTPVLLRLPQGVQARGQCHGLGALQVEEGVGRGNGQHEGDRQEHHHSNKKGDARERVPGQGLLDLLVGAPGDAVFHASFLSFPFFFVLFSFMGPQEHNNTHCKESAMSASPRTRSRPAQSALLSTTLVLR